MTALAALFAASFVTALSGALAPGPLLTVTIAEAHRRGAIVGPLLIVGHALLEMAMVAALLLGVSAVLGRPTVVGVTGIVGAVVLVWMGIGILRESAEEVFAATDSRGSGRHPVVLGAIISAVNPYWTIWWLTIGAAFLTRAVEYRAAGVIAFFVGHILADLGWYTLVATGVDRGKGIVGPTVLRAVLVVCGVFLLGLAAYFAYDGVSRLTG